MDPIPRTRTTRRRGGRGARRSKPVVKKDLEAILGELRCRSGGRRAPAHWRRCAGAPALPWCASCASAQRRKRWRLAAIDMPMPVPQISRPRCALPSSMRPRQGVGEVAGSRPIPDRCSAEIEHLEAKRAQLRQQSALQIIAAMIGGNGDNFCHVTDKVGTKRASYQMSRSMPAAY